ncbi:MAG TPA: lysoplasmalogenase [Candidatus Hydrogenedentes bacterium]|nr:lysoplasmalogenase [Candidatus Hydrogenedentota bacterium]
MKIVSIVYLLLALAGISLNFFPLFAGVGVIKAIPACLLAAAALAYTRNVFWNWVALGVFCGAMGDFFLASLSKTWYLPGLVAFLLGHLFYIAAFRKNCKATSGKIMILAACAMVIIALMTGAALKVTRTGEFFMIPPGILYAAVILTMTSIAVLHKSTTRLIALGAIVFVISDAHIVLNFAILTAPWLPLTITGYTTYYLAQYLIILGAVREAQAVNPL